jgi:GntR family transcriptional regulator
METRRSHPQRNGAGRRFKVSQGTVRKAIDELAAENLLVRRQGKGTLLPPMPSTRCSTVF